MNDFLIRPIAEAEWSTFNSLIQETFNVAPPPSEMDRGKSVMEFERTLAAFDGDLLVGCAAIYSLTMTVPGGSIPVAGVTGVSVLASHRRRGILRSLMTRQLHGLHETGEAVAALYASEAAIYGRFGYGRSADSLSFRISTRATRFAPHVPMDPKLRLRAATPTAAREDIEKVFDEIRASRPGLYARSAGRWDGVLVDEEYDRGLYGPLRCMIAEDDAGPRGYVLFRVKRGWTEHNLPDGEIRLAELFATDPAAYAALWRSVLDRDLCAHLYAESRPPDDPLVHLLAEPRELRAGWTDELWVRLVDVDMAMPARHYAAPVDVVIEVEDPLCPWNEGRWRLAADTTGASFERTRDAPDLALPVSVLGAAYLGGRPLVGLADAGVVREARPGALRSLSIAMSWDPKPWAGLVF
ncbi:MAG TPA: GNAT family N-acetyltransferase [Thermopolyspora sp.]|jgi:Predicted acetyltransferase involved in intracellular survival and related acetyltransferases